MKDNLRILAAITKMIDADRFYCITVHHDNIKLQGRANSDLIALLLRTKFQAKPIGPEGFVEFQRGCIEVTLT